jgi:hypothetical protein
MLPETWLTPSSLIYSRNKASCVKVANGSILPFGMAFSLLLVNKNGEIWTGQMDLQQISSKADRLPGELTKIQLHRMVYRNYDDSSHPFNDCVFSWKGSLLGI